LGVIIPPLAKKPPPLRKTTKLTNNSVPDIVTKLNYEALPISESLAKLLIRKSSEGQVNGICVCLHVRRRWRWWPSGKRYAVSLRYVGESTFGSRSYQYILKAV